MEDHSFSVHENSQPANVQCFYQNKNRSMFTKHEKLKNARPFWIKKRMLMLGTKCCSPRK